MRRLPSMKPKCTKIRKANLLCLKVYGFAPTTRVVKSLSETGVSARTVASLLESQARHASKQIWVIDESSLLPTRQVNRILIKHASKASGGLFSLATRHHI